ncbi:L,D-transpeptidase catalytic domain [Salinihabitans flavidus]|uniref:L,D-transpeptidase catalytic domain n=1 Tax=Salinihabitans flavidus TaxID=569882 RepID=A0A1H8LWM5_9RHOB|nr:L,D-transpeptidase family protein [Salinihabitans flavidus]SEO09554.1 L,D-transpeptidase catalytic domain [Salinihabitans flavidus]
MRILSWLLIAALGLGLAACSKFQTYNGPEVTRVLVYKGERKIYLLHHDRVLKHYDMDLGFAPNGHKAKRGDGRTPEGDYAIDRRNPNSEFYLSIGISYPNKEDIARAKAAGEDPGGDIFIHGNPRRPGGRKPDWTAGCISVTNAEMREIYAMVRNGTPISIYP